MGGVRKERLVSFPILRPFGFPMTLISTFCLLLYIYHEDSTRHSPLSVASLPLSSVFPQVFSVSPQTTPIPSHSQCSSLPGFRSVLIFLCLGWDHLFLVNFILYLITARLLLSSATHAVSGHAPFGYEFCSWLWLCSFEYLFYYFQTS